MRQVLLMVAGVMTVVAAVTAVQAEEASVGQHVSDFTLRDYHGKEVSLGDFADSKLVVVAFLGTDCPMVKLYGARLDEIAKKY